ncbi:GyrI-like domain-containing protein [Sinomonas sp. ASV486]|uniref:GyrI-like domain-containing protein n=1 Tax=Sinomonas puerhi TaxID=3238584 RepID=A0AB39L7E0_9MICC|nr:GyrI-like domain-containing protein [Sinomonas sp. ASV486]MDQ4490475.1 GyrI-like domain-containing protein [Sinomonas sp. ASV486]
MTEISTTELTEQPTAVVRTTVRMDELKDFFDGVFGTVMGAVQSHGAHVAGPPFALYHGMPGETVDVEAGFPVAGPFEGGDGVTASILPGGRTVTAMHVGPYEGLADTYREMTDWMREQNLTRGESMWEVYLSDPSAEPDPAAWRTEVFCPVE